MRARDSLRSLDIGRSLCQKSERKVAENALARRFRRGERGNNLTCRGALEPLINKRVAYARRIGRHLSLAPQEHALRPRFLGSGEQRGFIVVGIVQIDAGGREVDKSDQLRISQDNGLGAAVAV